MKAISNNTAAILSDLSGAILHLNEPGIMYPDDTGRSAFIEAFGIRSLTANTLSGKLAFPDKRLSMPLNDSQYKWCAYKNEGVVEDLKALLTNCPIISFADWSEIAGASGLWDGLLHDVIKDLHKRDFEFIFYLGDPTKRLAQEVDEILDIISNFSLYGRVTLALHEEEASKLWMVLNGYDPAVPLSAFRLPGAEEKYFSILNTMNINNLLIRGIDRVLSLSKQEPFELVDKAHSYGGNAMDVRNNFNAGYILGLQLQLEISHCIALGLAVSGSYMENGISPDQGALLLYIKRWMAELTQRV